MSNLDRRTWFGLTVGFGALLLAWSAMVTGDADARTKKKAVSKAKVGAILGVYSCEPEFEKRPAGARLLQKDPLNSGAWMIPGIDPMTVPRVTIMGCREDFLEPSGQLRPFWRNKQQPPLPPAAKFEICENVAVARMAVDRAWFSCSPSDVLRVRVD